MGLEPLAPVGGILVSESVYRNIANKKGIETKFLREEALKNVKDPVKIYQVEVSDDGAEQIAKTSTSVSSGTFESKPATRKFLNQIKIGFDCIGRIGNSWIGIRPI